MKTFLSISLLSLLTLSSFGQNLVNNPSFEDTITCPTGVNQVYNANGWYGLILSPDYYHSCATSQVGVPSNFLGNQNPATGNAYAGFFPYEVFTGREMFGSKLLTPLIIGQDYFVSFKVSLADDTITTLTCATNNLGVLFSVDSAAYFNINFAHIYTDSIITDMDNWTTIFGSFTADSVYKYISVGNFFDNSNTDTIMIGNAYPFCRSYYYVDDICVSSDSTCYAGTGITSIIPNPAISVFPNPTNGDVYIKLNGNGKAIINVYSVLGELMTAANPQQISSNKYKIDLSRQPCGIYFISVHINNTINQQKILLIH